MSDTPKECLADFNEDFSKMVADFIEKNSSVVFGNKTSLHAKDIMIQFFNAAQKSIEILSGSMMDLFYSDDRLIEALGDAAKRLKQDKAIRIITAATNKDDIKRIVDVITDINNKCCAERIAYIPARYEGEEPLHHMMLVDGKRYRYEDAHDNLTSTEEPFDVHADVCCNDPEFVNDKLSFFNAVWTHLAKCEVKCYGAALS